MCNSEALELAWAGFSRVPDAGLMGFAPDSLAGMNAAVRAVTRMGIYVGAKVFLIYEVRRVLGAVVCCTQVALEALSGLACGSGGLGNRVGAVWGRK